MLFFWKGLERIISEIAIAKQVGNIFPRDIGILGGQYLEYWGYDTSLNKADIVFFLIRSINSISSST